uniref:Nucleoporin NSP1-like C-terminal domain-containing protein n=1 Tax=Glossina morsitans morsitans TaxID=37546 RepID=A0A1B0GBX5_GLOMM
MSFQLSVNTTTASATTGTQEIKPGEFSFGAIGGGDADAKLTFPLSATTTTAAVASPVAPPTTSTSGFNLCPGSTTATTSATNSFGFGTSSSATSTAAASFGFGISVTSTAAAITSVTTIPALISSAATCSATGTTVTFATLTTATKTTDSAAINRASQISYSQIEELINKWTLELEEQEKVFTDQATQINAWDKILIGNNQKIFELNDAVQKIKNDQQTLEQELEFIATQHKELEESILPLQKEFMKIPQVDIERAQTYLMVENLDTQLKQMSEDLKEIIDNLNEASNCQDSTDPIIQVGKILNAHMSSLQWIEQGTTNISNKLEDITKMHETFKRDTERSFRSAYYN